MDLPGCESQNDFPRDIKNDTHMDHDISFQDAKDRYRANEASSPVPFSPAAKVGLIQLNLSSQEAPGILSMDQCTHTDCVQYAIDGFLRHSFLIVHLVYL